jgi:hypothetical protein
MCIFCRKYEDCFKLTLPYQEVVGDNFSHHCIKAVIYTGSGIHVTGSGDHKKNVLPFTENSVLKYRIFQHKQTTGLLVFTEQVNSFAVSS